MRRFKILFAHIALLFQHYLGRNFSLLDVSNALLPCFFADTSRNQFPQ